MPSVSGRQRRAAGAALSAKRSPNKTCKSLPKGSASRSMCKSMTKKELRDFAKKRS